MEAGDVYLVQCEFALSDGQTAVLNHFYQAQSTVPGTVAANIVSQFNAVVQSNFASMMDENYSLARQLIININDPDDFGESTTPVAGARTGSQLPTAMTVTLKSDRSGPGYRYSYRHYPFGVQSDLTDNDGTWASGLLAEAAALGVDLGATLSPVSGGTLEPCQVASGWTYGSAPTVRQLLDSTWGVLSQPGWLRSRQVR